jgi:hypothetical protein
MQTKGDTMSNPVMWKRPAVLLLAAVAIAAFGAARRTATADLLKDRSHLGR